MKGVILRINPHALLVDICHGVETHDIVAGAMALAHAYKYFSDGAIHLAVIDPGVGSDRQAIILETSGAYFVGPDNGLFSLIYEKETVVRIVAIENPKFMAPVVSRTFHGRDVFAPAAGFLSLGVSIDLFGPPVNPRRTIPPPQPRISTDMIEGEVIHVDRFGNLITNVSADQFTRFIAGQNHEMWIAERKVSGPYGSYADGGEGQVFGIFGSAGLLEISMREVNAQRVLGLQRGAVIRIVKSQKGGVRA
jgi:S-adenosylmethionine hydrolase